MNNVPERPEPESNLAALTPVSSAPGVFGWPLIVVRLAALLVTCVICVACYYALQPVTRRNPVPPFFLHAVAVIAGIRLRTRGPRPARGEKRIFLANHVSWMDIPGLAGASGCAFVAHDGLTAIGTLRWLCEMNNTVFVARHDRRSVAHQVERVRTALTNAGSLTLFPEGTTSDGTTLLTFKSSLLAAVDTGSDTIPIQPVWLDYGPSTHELAWVGEEPGLTNVLRILARWRPVKLTVHFLPALTCDQRGSRKTIALAARSAILAAMQAA